MCSFREKRKTQQTEQENKKKHMHNSNDLDCGCLWFRISCFCFFECINYWFKTYFDLSLTMKICFSQSMILDFRFRQPDPNKKIKTTPIVFLDVSNTTMFFALCFLLCFFLPQILLLAPQKEMYELTRILLNRWNRNKTIDISTQNAQFIL